MTGQEYLKELRGTKCNKMQMGTANTIPDFRKEQYNIEQSLMKKYLNLLENDEFLDMYFQQETERFISCLPTEVQNKLKNVVVGVIPSFIVNASAIMNIDCEDYVIVLHTQLMSIISQFCEVQMLMGKSIHNEDLKRFCYEELKKIVDCYKYQQDAIRLHIIDSQLNKEEMTLMGLQTTIIETFVIAHELAHIYLGHCGKAENKEVCLKDDRKISVFEHRKLMELEADKQAFLWLIEVIRCKDYSEMISVYRNEEALATEIFQLFHLIEVSTGEYDEVILEAKEKASENGIDEILNRLAIIMNRVDNIIQGKDTESKTHPLAMERLMYIANTVETEKKMRDYMFSSIMDGMYIETYDVRKLV